MNNPEPVPVPEWAVKAACVYYNIAFNTYEKSILKGVIFRLARIIADHTPKERPKEDAQKINTLCDDLYSAFCDYNSRQQNVDRFRNRINAFLATCAPKETGAK